MTNFKNDLEAAAEKTLKPIPDHDGYYADKNGDLWCKIKLKFKCPDGRLMKMKPYKHNEGYKVAHMKVNGKYFLRRVHRMVLLAFRGKPKKGQICCHRNGIKDDNRIANLYWGTASQNEHDKKKHGTHSIGTSNPNITKALLGRGTGAHWNSRRKYWCSNIRFRNKIKYLGKFKTKKDAENAYKKEANRLIKQHFRGRGGE